MSLGPCNGNCAILARVWGNLLKKYSTTAANASYMINLQLLCNLWNCDFSQGNFILVFLKYFVEFLIKTT